MNVNGGKGLWHGGRMPNWNPFASVNVMWWRVKSKRVVRENNPNGIVTSSGWCVSAYLGCAPKNGNNANGVAAKASPRDAGYRNTRIHIDGLHQY